jgi:hypothetical protein
MAKDKQCRVEGCTNPHKEKSQVSRPKNRSGGEYIGTERVKDAEPGKNTKNVLLGQMLYASDLLDRQINSSMEGATIDAKVILDIRHRLGEVLRGV